MLGSVLTTNSADDLKTQTMSGQPMDSYAWHTAPPSTSVTGTSELFSSTFAMLSDNSAYPEQWGMSKPVASQSILFEQPQIQPIIGNSYDPPVRFDAPGAYRQTTTYLPTVATQPYYPQRPVVQFPPSYQAPAAQGQNYFPTTTASQPQVSQTQLLLSQSVNTQVMRPEPLRPNRATNNDIISNNINRNGSNNISVPIARATPPQPARQTSAASAISPCDEVSLSSPALTSSGSAASGTPPLANDHISTELEGPDEERVMCMACRGVYPSRRSLTGHIGRNEKCREIIGRNYLDAVANGTNPPIPGTDAAIKSGAITTGQDGMSPVCPFCDRFISHYKGNIRRHINQCCKNTDPLKRQKFDPKDKHGKKRRKTEDGFHQPDFNDYEGSQMSPPSSSFYGGSELCSPNGYPYDFSKKDQPTPDDAYICEDCDFVTVYKGNMKRHLNTCHPIPECKNLKVTEWDSKLEGMRASNMGIVGDRLQEKLALHKQNSSRGRKPRKKKENQNSEESEPMEFKPVVNDSQYLTFAQ